MKEQLIRLASLKGFDQEVNNGVGIFFKGDIFENDKAYFIWLCLLQKWLIENYNLFISVDQNSLGDYFLSTNCIGIYGNFNSIEKALEDGLFAALNLIK